MERATPLADEELSNEITPQLLTTLRPALIYIHKDCLLNVNTIIMAITLNITYKVY